MACINIWGVTLCYQPDLQRYLLSQGYVAIPENPNLNATDIYGEYHDIQTDLKISHENMDNAKSVKPGDLVAIPHCICNKFGKYLEEFDIFQVTKTAISFNQALPNSNYPNLDVLIEVKPYKADFQIKRQNCHNNAIGSLKNRVWKIGTTDGTMYDKIKFKLCKSLSLFSQSRSS